MSRRIMNARMYAVTAEVETAWQELLQRVSDAAGVSLEYVRYPAPAPLEELWRRPDLGCVLMCGYPIALQLAQVIPIAAPIPRAVWACGRPVYRSDLIVREDAPYQTLADTFGGRAGWTVGHTQSGFNAFRHELLEYRSAQRPTLYGEMVGNLVTARNILDAVREGRIDVGPLDAYWHLLIARHAPHLTAGIRVLASTPLTPMPAFIAAAGTDQRLVADLREAFTAAAQHTGSRHWATHWHWTGFAAVDAADYQQLLDWDQQARAAGFGLPA